VAAIGKRGRTQMKKVSKHSDRNIINAVGKMVYLKDMMEVNIFKENNEVIHITNPKVSVSQTSKCYLVKGDEITKPLEYFLPDITSQLTSKHSEILRKFVDSQEIF